MPRAPEPLSPSHDIEARRNCAGPIIAGVLTEELVAFCQSGVSVILGASISDGCPVAGIALACVITPEGIVRVHLREPANLALIAAVDAGSAIAATFSEPRTHRSIQIKARRAKLAPVPTADLPEVSRQVGLFGQQLEEASYSLRLIAHYSAYVESELAAIEFSPCDAFVQTPGPGAGSLLGP